MVVLHGFITIETTECSKELENQNNMYRIAGIIVYVKEQNITWLGEAALNSKHRGLDTMFRWIAPSGNAVLAYRTLSVIDT